MPAKGSAANTPKGARTQTSIVSFFRTPVKAEPRPNGPDSQEALLAETDALFDADMMAEIDQAEEAMSSPIPRSRKRKIERVDMDIDDPQSEEDDDDDDADEDYTPAAAGGTAPRGRRSGRQIRRIDEDSDSDGNTTEEAPSSPVPARQRRNGNSRSLVGSGAAAPATPDLARLRYSAAGASSSSDGTPLISLLGSQGPKAQIPALSRANTSTLSAASSSSTPLMQRMQLQSPASPSTAKVARAAAFAKKNEKRYAWLEDVLDAQRLGPGEPGYDKRSLYVPPGAWQDFSPFERQYWEIKSKHWDTVVFFKKGKFYELYENDATIAHREFDLKLTDRVNMRMAGVPESSFDHWVAQFLAKGYKIARVDQMESRLAKDMRERGSSKKGAALVVRELTGVLTAGTLVEPSLLTQDLATYCMALVEATEEDGAGATGSPAVSFGIAFVDASTAHFHLCTIKDDDAHRSGLETLLVQLNPREVVYVRGGAGPGQRTAPALPSSHLSATGGSSSFEDALLSSPDAWDGMAGISQATWRTLKNTCGPRTEWISLAPRKEFWDMPTTKHEIEQAEYFDGGEWPGALQRAVDHSKLGLTATGGLLSYLRSLKLDRDLASLGNFSEYAPMQHATAMVLDGPTLSNLDIFTVSADDESTNPVAAAARIGNKATSIDGTLFSLLNHARTPFGRRALSQWACHPLRHAPAINARLDVVDYFMANGDISDSISQKLTELPDLERGLSRIHSGRCKVPDFLALLAGLATVDSLVDQLLQTHGASAPARIKALLGSFPPLGDVLTDLHTAFDADLAEKEGRLVPFAGSDGPYDEATAAIAELDQWLEQHLRENRKQFGCASIVYKHMGKEHYQLEMPATVKVPDAYFRLSATKAVNRYWSPELRIKAQQRAEAMETKSMVLDSYQTRLYARFDKHYGLAMKAVSVVAELDALIALTVASGSLGGPSCRPTVLDSNGDAGGYIEFRQLRHPCVALGSGAADFVANDIVLGRRDQAEKGADSASMALLTGPNMGGKSTLLRQLCLGVILAQLGCYVPAESATVLPVDRLFTRIGARDNLLAGRSTFMVEMAETSTILRYATPRSLVVLDELGRGTSTHDGEAVAFGVLHELCSRLGCLGFFSTHYGLLAESLLASDQGKGTGSPGVEPHLRPVYMACAVNEEEHRVTFLYKLQRGVASKSYGMNVAAMAGVPMSIVRRASDVAEQFERSLKRRQPASSESEATLPLTLQSDFANLLRMAKLQSEAVDSSDGVDGHEPPVGGTQRAKKANENQYWSCIVDHLRRTIGGAAQSGSTG
ncbi:DNA mismatch repair protein msh6 [Coemansia sp. RSA 552]|nr:DNA mismatch repair protein msh6 [Coemansia sp. RSA 552]